MTLNRRSKRHVEFIETIRDMFPAIKIAEEYKIGNNLFIDIYLPSYSIGVEIDGEQHDSWNSFFHGNSEEKFVLQKFLDSKKERLCKENSIFLYRIKASDNRSTRMIIIDILNKARKNYKVENVK